MRDKDGLDHETAMRESIVSVLMSPDFCYRIDLVDDDQGIHPLSDYDLASRLSYFLWSSMPDDELLAHAAAGDLHEPTVIVGPGAADAEGPARPGAGGRVRRQLARFPPFRRDQHGRSRAVSRVSRRDLREAMFEEPVRFLMDVFQNNRPILDLLYANDTFVNPVLAKHYGIPVRSAPAPMTGCMSRMPTRTTAAGCCRWRCS